MTRPLKDENNICFGCSPNNPIGLKMGFEMYGDVCRSRFTPAREHQSWNDVVHGGLLATMMDEAMGKWLWEHGLTAMTAEMTIRYSAVVPVGATLTIESYMVSQKRKLIEMAASITLPDGTVAARAKAKFLEVTPAAMPRKEEED
ncbi:PaaI family thioesterase [Pelotomaculum propionicicum]|uniref:PaaI family thioesterase n=1 Tax=Pelotomaculum propionicicum TaxID=258475 RepID=UPI003B773177